MDCGLAQPLAIEVDNFEDAGQMTANHEEVDMARRISGERKTAYYIGMGLTGAGLLMFLSTFVAFAANFGDFTDFKSRATSNMFVALGGMALMFVGGIVRSIGQRGLAGSGVVLDPDKAREELEPYSRMTGGMVKDALDEAGVDLGARGEKIVMIKCRSCSMLNEESAKFCKECGTQI